MVCVTTDGTINFVLGPYEATMNDAKVLESILTNSHALDNLIPGDVLLLDRGFRDYVQFLRDRCFDVRMPALLQRSESRKQLTVAEANRSRFVTVNRYGVETRNKHIKTIFKIFQKEWNPRDVNDHLMADVRICAALINVYFRLIESNKGMEIEIGTRMIDRLGTPNQLPTIVFRDNFQRKLTQLQPFRDFDELPTLTERDLIMIALGRYQIKQAASYCQEHFRANNSDFAVFECPQNICEIILADFFVNVQQPKLLMARLNSRFRSQKKHDAYVLIDMLGQGESAVMACCCDCYNGLRTVGCCSHIMCIIWFTLHIKNPATWHRPAQFLDNYFNEALSSNSDSQTDSD